MMDNLVMEVILICLILLSIKIRIRIRTRMSNRTKTRCKEILNIIITEIHLTLINSPAILLSPHHSTIISNNRHKKRRYHPATYTKNLHTSLQCTNATAAVATAKMLISLSKTMRMRIYQINNINR